MSARDGGVGTGAFEGEEHFGEVRTSEGRYRLRPATVGLGAVTGDTSPGRSRPRGSLGAPTRFPWDDTAPAFLPSERGEARSPKGAGLVRAVVRRVSAGVRRLVRRCGAAG